MENISKKAVTNISKRRYQEICDALMVEFNNTLIVERVAHIICDKLGFDPNAKTYNEARAQSTAKYRQKLKNLGIPRSDYKPKANLE